MDSFGSMVMERIFSASYTRNLPKEKVLMSDLAVEVKNIWC